MHLHLPDDRKRGTATEMMKSIRLFFVLTAVSPWGGGLHTMVSASATKPTMTEQEKIDAVLALAESSLNSCEKEDKGAVMKNAMILLSEFKDNKQASSALAELLAGTEKNEKKCEGFEPQDFFPEDLFLNYADRHARRLEDIVHDDDCMKREFDAADPNFDPAEAAEVYSKCRLVVVRNAFPRETMEAYKRKFDDYVLGIHNNDIDKSNTQTNDARVRDIVQYRGRKRHDIMLPKYLAGEEIAGNKKILDLLRHDLVLGPDMQLNQVGSVIAEGGGPSMYWHEDQEYIYSPTSFENSGIGGHNLLPYVVNMFVPLLDAEAEHGPTEFCMGSSHLAGIPYLPRAMNKSLVEDGSRFQEMQEFQWTSDACPPEHWRVPLVGLGDAVLFDYHLTHRGGPNMNPELRSLLYVIYSRSWFRDLNFDDNKYAKGGGKQGDKGSWEEWASGLRYAMIDESTVPIRPKADTTLAAVQNFAGIKEDPPKDGYVSFKFTNINVEGASLFSDDQLRLKEMPKMKQWTATDKIGSMLTARDKDGKVIRKWRVEPDQGQTVLAV